MALDDIRVYQAPLGGHTRVQHWRVNAAEGFFRGEPVSVNADGELTESADDPQDEDIMGIAASDGVVGTTYDFKTGTAMVTGALIPVIIPDSNTYFVCNNFGTTSEQFDQDLVVANLGDEAGLELVSGTWGINTGAANNTCRIIDLLDADGNSIQDSGGTVVQCVFLIVAHQSVVVDAPAA